MFRVSVVVSSLLLAALTTLPAYADNNDLDTGPLELLWLADGIYAVAPKFAGANGALILSESGNIVVDTHGSPASAQALIDAVAQVSDQPIRFVINTHWHVDHHSGNTAYEQAYGADVIFVSHEDTRSDIPSKGIGQFEQAAPYRNGPVKAAEAALANGTNAHGERLAAEQIAAIKRFRDEQSEFAARRAPEFRLADLTFSKSITLHGKPNTVEVFFLHPAHTRSDSLVYIKQEEILIIGDLLTQPILWSWSSYPASYVATLTALEALPIRKIVIGHGGPVLEGKAYLTLVREFLETSVAFARQSLAAGMDEQAAIAAASDSPVENFRRRFVSADQDSMFDQMVGWTVSRAYLEMASQ